LELNDNSAIAKSTSGNLAEESGRGVFADEKPQVSTVQTSVQISVSTVFKAVEGDHAFGFVFPLVEKRVNIYQEIKNSKPMCQ
jgi:hypothetical protein